MKQPSFAPLCRIAKGSPISSQSRFKTVGHESDEILAHRQGARRIRESTEFDALMYGRQACGQVEILDPRQTGIGQHRLEGFLVGMHAD